MALRTTTRSGSSIAFADDGDGPAVVFVHGLGDDHSTWDSIVERLVSRRRCIRIDVRGQGASGPAPTYETLELSYDLDAVVEELGLEKPFLVGHSLGGFIATTYAARREVRGVLNVDQSLQIVGMAQGVRPLKDVLTNGDYVAVVRSVIESIGYGRLDEPARAAHVERLKMLRREVLLGAWHVLLEDSDDVLGEKLSTLSNIRAPYHALHGNPLPSGYATWLAELIEGATTEVWEGNGHYPHVSEPSRFAELVLAKS
ncbi:putative hydrolase [Labilithrix luteola]|uniref:Putative hydrolase n=1 Tax=Labilithrix luteola TaxID=1391654 RepID=A0A0K1PS07_9BACT|nr:alpha/beta hydrolase [Labilithrix luteola]AKU96320.1 putative hydrolase [Labilithrix luteola]